MRWQPGPCGHGNPISRRAALRGVLGIAAASGLSGCSLRLEDDAPAIPLVPRKSIPDEAYLLDLYADSLTLASATAGLAETAPAALRGLTAGYRAQAAFLADFLTARGVDPAASPGATPTGTAVAGVTPELAAAQTRLLTAQALAPLATVTADNRALVLSLLSYRGAAATILRRALGEKAFMWPTLPGDPLPGERVVPLLDASRATAYGLDVVAARSGGPTRERANATRARLRVRIRAQEGLAGEAAGPAPLAHPVARPTGSTEARTLARTLLRRLVAVGLAAAPATSGGATAQTLLVWQSQALVELAEWGSAWPALPGLDAT